MTLSPRSHFLMRALTAAIIGYGLRAYAANYQVALPPGLAVNVGMGIFFLIFWIWPFPWGDMMLLAALEKAQQELLPHDRLWSSPVNCTDESCVLSGSRIAKCIRIRHMADQTRKRIDNLNDAIFRGGAPYWIAIIAIVIVSSLNSGTPAAAVAVWQIVASLLVLLSVTWWLAIIYGEVSYQRRLNFDLLL